MNSPFDLKDKVAVVTGGAGGIGTEIAMEYARAGASIILASRNRDSLENVATEISKLGVRAPRRDRYHYTRASRLTNFNHD